MQLEEVGLADSTVAGTHRQAVLGCSGSSMGCHPPVIKLADAAAEHDQKGFQSGTSKAEVD